MTKQTDKYEDLSSIFNITWKTMYYLAIVSFSTFITKYSMYNVTPFSIFEWTICILIPYTIHQIRRHFLFNIMTTTSYTGWVYRKQAVIYYWSLNWWNLWEQFNSLGQNSKILYNIWPLILFLLDKTWYNYGNIYYDSETCKQMNIMLCLSSEMYFLYG